MRALLLVAVVISGLVSACSKPPEAPPADRAAAPSEPAITVPVAAANMLDARKEHHHEPPHGGALVMIGDHAGHLEFVLDAESGTLTMYALDGEADRAVAVNSLGIVMQVSPPGKGPVELQLKPVTNVLTGETEASTSQYEAQSDALKGVAEFTGVIPELAFRGMEVESLAVAYPGGSE